MHAPKVHELIHCELEKVMAHFCKHGLNRADIELMHTLVHIEEYLDDWMKEEPHTYHGGMDARHISHSTTMPASSTKY